MTKIIFLDIDGTLLSFRTHRVPQSTIEAVAEARRQGIKVWIATGRPLPFVRNLGELEYDGIMCVNGAQCQLLSPDRSRWTVIHSQPVPREDVERMIGEQHRTGLAVVYAGNERAILTTDLYRNRVVNVVGGYYMELGHVDAIAFTAGLGENDVFMRERVLKHLEEGMGLSIDYDLNAQIHGKECLISKPDSKIAVWIVPTNEELMIARDTVRLLGL